MGHRMLPWNLEIDGSEDESPQKGSNFLVSAIMILRKQRDELRAENRRLKEKIRALEGQNAAFLNLNADRLLQSEGKIISS